MSARLIAAAEANIPEPGRDAVVPHVALVREAVATLGWSTMKYGCGTCGFEWEVWLALGVEGPPSLRTANLMVPAPFTTGRCPAWPVRPGATAEDRARFRHLTRCEGEMSHVRFSEDREFAPTLIPDDVPRFTLDPWHEHGVLVISSPALIAARRFHDR